MELKLYGRRMCSKQPYCVDHCRCGPQARPSTSFVDRLNVAKFSKSSSFGQVRQKEVLLFLRNQNVLITKTVGSFRAKTSSIRQVASIQYWLVTDSRTDKQMDKHMTTAYTALAWRRAVRTASFLAIFQLPNVAILMCCSVPEVVFEASTPWPRREVS